MDMTVARICVPIAAVVVLLLLPAVSWVPLGHAQSAPCAAAGPEVKASPAFYTGYDLNALSDHDLEMYASGYVDVLQAATVIGVTELCRQMLQRCVMGHRQQF
jgi:hypothetical protein